MTELVVYEEIINFDTLDVTDPNIFCVLSALTRQTLFASGVYRIRIGGTLGAADGTVVAVLTTVNPAYVLPPDFVQGAAFLRPTGPQLVKLTANATVLGARAYVRGYQISFVADSP